ncbi:uncharacterized protein LOC115441783 [Manduca sexta]|uniref:Protein sleepless n=1 Tax=Manduca sexta TaxID=7130 RepID=A0A921YY31_MANSE|nr:uncharacterized protein LOC115441783 [Manduca sexta]KAG6447503.1 hypothetical protein O3G_MSEX004987 [Manduca sexta]
MRYALVFLFLCAAFEWGFAIMCYECNSAINSLCLEKVLPESLKKNCSDHDKGVTHTMCRKIIQHVDHSVNGKYPESRVVRSCGWDETKFKGMCYHRAGYGGRQEVCSCMTDYCNGAFAAHSSTALLIFTVLQMLVTNLCK